MTDDAVQLHVSLTKLTPSIWRRLLVPTTWTLRQLHFAIQYAMPWGDRHLYEFDIAGNRYGAPDPFDEDDDLLDDVAVLLADALPMGSRARYTYDFGDNWQHDITVEALSAKAHLSCPGCLDGAGAAPPDDVGGVDRYAHFVKAMEDPGHPEHAEWRTWIGRDWDPLAFSAQEATQALANGAYR